VSVIRFKIQSATSMY